MAACGAQVAAHVQAAETVHSALTSILSGPTTRLVIRAQDLPGEASIADGSFSFVVTTSQATGSSSSSHRSVDVSIYHESTSLMDLREVNESLYFRLDLMDIAAFAGPGTFAAISHRLGEMASRPGLGYIHDILVGKWVGISNATLLAVAHQLEHQIPGSGQSTLNVGATEQFRNSLVTSVLQSLRIWLSIHRKSANEYTLSLPIRNFAGSLLHEMAKPLQTYLDRALPSDARFGKLALGELGKAIAEIPANLFVHMNMWVRNGSVSKLQIFIPGSRAYVIIGVSHPATPVQVPRGATMLSERNILALEALAGPLTSRVASSAVASAPLQAISGT